MNNKTYKKLLKIKKGLEIRDREYGLNMSFIKKSLPPGYNVHYGTHFVANMAEDPILPQMVIIATKPSYDIKFGVDLNGMDIFWEGHALEFLGKNKVIGMDEREDDIYFSFQESLIIVSLKDFQQYTIYRDRRDD